LIIRTQKKNTKYSVVSGQMKLRYGEVRARREIWK